IAPASMPAKVRVIISGAPCARCRASQRRSVCRVWNVAAGKTDVAQHEIVERGELLGGPVAPIRGDEAAQEAPHRPDEERFRMRAQANRAHSLMADDGHDCVLLFFPPRWAEACVARREDTVRGSPGRESRRGNGVELRKKGVPFL